MTDTPSPATQILTLAAKRSHITNRDVVRATGLSRQAVHQHLTELVDADDLVKLGEGRGTKYKLVREASTSSSSVFVVHGRDENARRALFDFLRSIGLSPLEWNQAVRLTEKPMPYIGEVLNEAFSHAQAVVVLITPDDEGRLRPPFHSSHDPVYETDLAPQARQNVIFEAGMALGRSPERTVIVEVGLVRPFSDIAGLHVIKMNDSVARRQELAQRLEAAGCPVNIEGTDWHTSGTFLGSSADLETPEESESLLADQTESGGATIPLIEGKLEPDDGTGFLEKLVEMEGAMPELTATMADIASVTNEFSTAAEESTRRIHKSDESGAGMRGRLAVAIRMAETMDPYAARFEHLADRYESQIRRVDLGLAELLRILEQKTQLAPEEEELIETIEGLGETSAETTASLDQFERSLVGLGKIAKPLRERTSRIRHSLRRMISSSKLVGSWAAQAHNCRSE